MHPAATFRDRSAHAHLFAELRAPIFRCGRDLGASRVDEILTEARRRRLTTWLAVDDHPTAVAASQSDARFIACEPDTDLSALPVQARLRAPLADLVNRP